MKYETASYYLIKEGSIINAQYRTDLLNYGITTDYTTNLYDLLSKIATNPPIILIIDGDKYTISEEFLSLFSIKSVFFVPCVIIITDKIIKMPNSIYNNIIIFDHTFYIQQIENLIIDILNKRIFYKNQLTNVTSRVQDISNQLHNLGITPRKIGFNYLRDCIHELMNRDCIGISFDTNLYPVISAKHNTTRVNIERSMRTAIQQGWESGLFSKILVKNCPLFKHRPTIKEFIYTIACHLYNHEICTKLAQTPNINSIFLKGT